jgi:hypothetical protein
VISSIKLQSVAAAGAQLGQPGYDTDLLYLAGLAALVLGGLGRFALDRLRRDAAIDFELPCNRSVTNARLTSSLQTQSSLSRDLHCMDYIIKREDVG